MPPRRALIVDTNRPYCEFYGPELVAIENIYGGWNGRPATTESIEMIFLARRL